MTENLPYLVKLIINEPAHDPRQELACRKNLYPDLFHNEARAPTPVSHGRWPTPRIGVVASEGRKVITARPGFPEKHPRRLEAHRCLAGVF